MGKKKLSKKDELILDLQERIKLLSEENNTLEFALLCVLAGLENETTNSDNTETETKTILPEIESVIYDNPKVIICWKDQTTTVARCMPEDTFSKEYGYFICVCKKALGNNKFRELLNKHLNYSEIR